VIHINATGFPQFFAAHTILRAAGVEPIASGGNEMRVPDDTDRAVLRAVAATGAAVDADLTAPAEPDDTGDSDTPAPTPARKPRKTTTRRTKE
jgi:hypothetical protein